jgi:acyl-CoA synthetase (AMP-forming)/AMP-acid ligase II
MAWVAERVAGYKRVRRVEFTDSIPRSPAGKILRRLFVEQEAGLSGQAGSGDHGHGN